jgi:elongation factor Ts
MTITAQDVKALRERTAAGMMECKKALEEANGDPARAEEILRERGQAKAAKKGDRETAQGRVGTMIHNGMIGAMVELQCETDFVAKTEDFQKLLNQICLHVVGMNPTYLSREDVPAELVEKERARYAEEVAGKPEDIQAKIIEGKIEKNLYAAEVLLDQPFVNETDFKGTVGELVTSAIGKLGENMKIARFVRFDMTGG